MDLKLIFILFIQILLILNVKILQIYDNVRFLNFKYQF